MKRYTLYSGFFDQRKKANNSAESPSGEWVPAEVAQALYDALVDCRYELLVRLQNEFGPKIAANCLSIIKSNAALSLSDGEE